MLQILVHESYLHFMRTIDCGLYRKTFYLTLILLNPFGDSCVTALLGSSFKFNLIYFIILLMSRVLNK